MESVVIITIFAVFVALGTWFVNLNYGYLKGQNRLFRNTLFVSLFILLPYFTTVAALTAGDLDTSKAHNPMTAFLFIILASIMIQNFKDRVSLK